MSKKFVTIVYVIFIVGLFLVYGIRTHSIGETLLNLILPFIGASALLTTYYRTRSLTGNLVGIHDKALPRSDEIFQEIYKANKVLLHCHPSPDPDSIGSALAMKYALEGIGKQVTVIQGDSDIPPAFHHFPGVDTILKKNFSEVDLSQFDLFISLDSGSPEMVSRKHPPVFPLSIRSVVIDHHASNKGYADVNYIVSAPSTTFILYKLFKTWNIDITSDIAANLFIGMYTDTGGFKYPPTDQEVYTVAGELVQKAPSFIDMISKMENSNDKDMIYGQAIALSHIETFHNSQLAISAVSYESLANKNISTNAISEGYIANILKSVVGWDIGVSMVEIEPGRIKTSFRSVKYDVSKLALAFGGGGHKAASGAVFTTTLSEAVLKVASTAKELYNL